MIRLKKEDFTWHFSEFRVRHLVVGSEEVLKYDHPLYFSSTPTISISCPQPLKKSLLRYLCGRHSHYRIFAALGWLQTVFFGLTDTIEAYVKVHPLIGPFLFILFAALSVMLGPATSAPLVPLAVVVWGPPLTFMYLFAGWVLGNMGAYAIGYYLGYPAVKKMMKKEKFDRWSALLDRKVTLLVALIVRIATPSETGYFFGIVRYHFSKFVFVSILAELPSRLLWSMPVKP